jgi:hypothetical protein
MKWILNITLAVEVLVALFWTMAMWTETGSSGIAVLGWFAVVIVVFAAAFLLGALIAWRRPALRRRAALVMAMPFIGGFAPYLLRAITGGPADTGFVWRVVALVAMALGIVALLRPRTTARRLPAALFRSRGFNAAVAGTLVVGWVLLLFLGGWLLSDGGQAAVYRTDRGNSGMAAAYLVLGVSAYLLLLGAASLLAAAWGWLGLAGSIDGARRRWHIAQLAGAVPGLLAAAATWAWLITQR